MGKKNKHNKFTEVSSSEEIVVLKHKSKCNNSNSLSSSKTIPTFETEQSIKKSSSKVKINKMKKIIISTILALISLFVINKFF